MKKIIYLLQFVIFIVLFNSCETYSPWDTQDSVPFKCEPEIPTEVSNSNYVYVTHKATLNNKEVRNYTLCFDKTKYAARWVAYPLHSCYIGGQDRSDDWAYDPNIVSSYQVSTYGYSTWGYTRGHQIPSADRTATLELNQQTFYMSNMTPQGYDYNSGIWLDLETRVRSYKCNDTLYVVTGAHWDNTYTNVSRYPVPTHYYKVLLRTRNGNTKKSVFGVAPEDLKCIGFWISHSATGSLNASYCKSVADIEALTGFTFFPQVDVDKTECIPSDWGY